MVSKYNKYICCLQTDIRVLCTNILTILIVKKGGIPMKHDTSSTGVLELFDSTKNKFC